MLYVLCVILCMCEHCVFKQKFFSKICNAYWKSLSENLVFEFVPFNGEV